MAFHYFDVLTFAFTPRDFQIELLATASEKNIITCLSQNTSKEFIALKLVQEFAYEVRREKNKKTTIYLSNRKTAYNLLHYLTDLRVINLNDLRDDEIDWENILDDYQVIILEAKRCLDALLCYYIRFEHVNLVIVDNCHCKDDQASILDIFTNYYASTVEKPKIFGLAGPIHNAQCPSARLGAELELLEYILKAKAETCSDIVTVLRYSPKPTEIIAECSPPKQNDVTNYLRNLILMRKAFIKDHRYDLSEIYGDYMDELKSVPDPTIEPLRYLDDFLNVLDELGAYCADKAALSLLIQIEKQKIKTPYERHFLLLCLVSTTFIQVRSFCETMFQQIKNEKERIDTYSSPKVQRILEVLRLFKPDKSNLNPPNKKALKNQENAEIEQKCHAESCIEIMNDIKSSNINSLLTTTSDNIQQISDNLESLKLSVNKLNSDSLAIPPQMKTHYNKFRFKNRKRFFYQRPNHHRFHNQNESDALCGLIFCNSTFTTKTLFCLFCEVSRHDPDLKFLNVQYTIDRTADPITEPKEYELEHRKQEEVLKKFRMHECNLLISTSVLEEGFDLPKCNLVVRWNPPESYRSYVQCKGRARAPNALHIIMVSPKIKSKVNELHGEEELSDSSHKFICDHIRQDKNCEILEKSLELAGTGSEFSGTSEVSETASSSDGESEDSDDIEENYPRKCVVEEVVRTDADIEGEDFYENVENCTNQIIDKLAEYMEIEKMLIRKCENKEVPPSEIAHAEKFTSLIQPYKPLPHLDDGASVNLSTAISLVNKYCAKLPSDTFTKLTPIWRCCKTTRNGQFIYQYTLRLPINSPMKHDILGLPMPTRILARRVAALIACRILHQSGELDDNLQPIGKEGFRAFEPDWENFELEKVDEQIVNENCEPRPGTTKRRQYYYKRIASVFSNCRPTTKTKAYLYHITMTLQCAIPEEQNTRGRKIYPPEEALQSFGILTTKKIPKFSAFPIFTRSGEVKVSLQLLKTDVTLDEEQLNKINIFINYTFTNVLRLRKYLMLFDPEAVENSFFVVPVFNSNSSIEIDWNFLELIKENMNMTPTYVSDEDRKAQGFDYNKFKDAVVMPWYRNQDQPQYFYVAEICYHLSPESSFPGENYSTFREYYFKKYGIEIQNKKQPLLDVDHTSARLNFLTPRYVNRKGVALPTSSEETKRAKRENLEQKQILVPELCTVHPFPASLWRAAVCLPCVLYRFNALLLADEIRMEVSDDLGLGVREIKKANFEWPTLDFGWTLADVLRKTKDAKTKEIEETKEDEKIEEIPPEDPEKEKEDLEKEKNEKDEKTANDLLEEVDEKLKNDGFQIGMWSNEMAEHIPSEFDDELGILPSNLELCSTRNTNIRYGSPTSWLAGSAEAAMVPYSDSDDDLYQSDDDLEGGTDPENQGEDFGFKIEFKSDHLAEAVETEEEVQRRQRKLDFINETFQNEREYQLVKNKTAGFNFIDHSNAPNLEENIERHEKMFQESIQELKGLIRDTGVLVKQNESILAKHRHAKIDDKNANEETPELASLVPYLDKNEVENSVAKFQENVMTLDELYKLNEVYTRRNPREKFQVVGCGDVFDKFADSEQMTIKENHVKEIKLEILNDIAKFKKQEPGHQQIMLEAPMKFPDQRTDIFSFDYQPNLVDHPGPSPSIILQALTMSNANDGINLERLETIGDSFLKYAITTYLYCTYENVHEGKLSHLRSKQVSNLNLYRLGRKKILGESMIATKFEPHDNWLPPCYFVPKELEQALIDAKIPACYWNLADLPDIKKLSSEEICTLVRERAEILGLLDEDSDGEGEIPPPAAEKPPSITSQEVEPVVAESYPCFIPYNLVTQHSIPDKSIADCVEALIGAYLIECGSRGALLFMAWLGIRVIPIVDVPVDSENKDRIPGSTREFLKDGKLMRTVYGHWVPPKSPLLRCTPHPEATLELLLDGFSEFEEKLGYHFNDRSYLLQAMTHASYSPNRLTDCYQRLEFLGDAVLDYLITRHLYEDPRQHSPGALTDLRSALVNNTIFASLAVRHDFHKYFRHLSPGLNEVIDRFVRIQHENGHSISEEYYLLSEEESEEAEDVEVPKALGDVFESVAGAIFLDSNMSLDCVWRVYSNMMKPEIEQFSCSVPKSPIRELLELEPETAKFGKPEKLADGRRVRVTVEVFGKGIFRGIGRNYRIAKCTAAKCALRQLKKQGLINKRH